MKYLQHGTMCDKIEMHKIVEKYPFSTIYNNKATYFVVIINIYIF